MSIGPQFVVRFTVYVWPAFRRCVGALRCWTPFGAGAATLLQTETLEEADAVADEFDAAGRAAAAALLPAANPGEELLADEPQPAARSTDKASSNGRTRRGEVSMAAQR